MLDVVDVYPRQQMQSTLLSWQHTHFKHHITSNPVKMVCFGTDSKYNKHVKMPVGMDMALLSKKTEITFQHLVLGVLI